MEKKDKYGLDELFFVVMKTEKDSEEFYLEMARKTPEAKKKGIFNYLAQQEKEHSDVSVNFLERVPQLSAIVSERVFKEDELSNMFEKTKTESELIDFAIKCEDDAIDFYKELQKEANEGLVLILDRLISEETGHREKLAGLLKES